MIGATLAKHTGHPGPTETSLALEAALRERMPERTLLGILARTAHWLDWHHRFSPAFGSDPKLADPLFRYVLTTFSADLVVLSPYVTARIQRFGAYATDEIALTPEPFNAHLGIDLAAAS